MKVQIGDIAVINKHFYYNGRRDGIVVKIIARLEDGKYTAKEVADGDTYTLRKSEFNLIGTKWELKYHRLKKKYDFQKCVIQELDDAVESLHDDIQKLKFEKDLK